eukprot:4974096-Alexandrium_andersonii.AAC.1
MAPWDAEAPGRWSGCVARDPRRGRPGVSQLVVRGSCGARDSDWRPRLRWRVSSSCSSSSNASRPACAGEAERVVASKPAGGAWANQSKARGPVPGCSWTPSCG